MGKEKSKHMKTFPTILEEEGKLFDEKVNEVRQEVYWGKGEDSPVHEFGDR